MEAPVQPPASAPKNLTGEAPAPLTAERWAVEIPVDGVVLPGELVRPAGAVGVVLFAHGSGSSRWSPRNRAVARVLERAGLGTLLFDLLTAAEEKADAVDGHLRFDVRLLARRLTGAAVWTATHAPSADLQLAFFGASTGAAAALMAAARLGRPVRAVVSRGGRTDLAGAEVTRVVSPTLLIVGGRDEEVLELNQQTFARLSAEKQLVVVPGATHLFAERGALAQVAALAADWCRSHFTPRP